VFAGLNQPQREAVQHGDGPLLVLAGAGSGKTRTLCSRVARLVADGVPPERILLLTFTRRAALQMLRRAGGSDPDSPCRRVWGGTFHAVGHRLLRLHSAALGLRPDFAVIDSGDAADLLDLLRDDLGIARDDRRMPRKDTALTVYSRTVNLRAPLREVVARHFPWCRDAVEPLAGLFRAYTARKRERGLLDYDDLLLYWHALAGAPEVGAAFDHVLCDEYQDTNPLQAEILDRMRATNRNVTVAGDDAQAIYSFRGASVGNILRFPADFPGARIVRLEQNYRSTQPILDTANAVLAAAAGGYSKALWTDHPGGARPRLHTCTDEDEQARRVCAGVLEQREQGLRLLDQAVLFRSGHHSAALELELSRRNIPFVKYGGLKFLEAAHVRDLLALLRLLDDRTDELAWFRVLQLLDGVGPATARRLLRALAAGGSVDDLPVPPGARKDLAALLALLAQTPADSEDVAADVERVRQVYAPLCARAYPDAAARLGDLDQLAGLAATCSSRSRFVAELVIDPPASTADLAGAPLLDEDYLILSTIHSAKGLEWEAVSVLSAVDGMIPSDMACGSAEEVEEERRLLYVALTRARRALDVYVPLRFYHQRFGARDAHSYAPVSRFLTGEVRALFDAVGPPRPEPVPSGGRGPTIAIEAVDEFLDALWG
jgi:DNA helicase-2/ATP-dependent DNA helicase PcrA